MVYVAKDAEGNQVNIIEIMPEQIESYERITGLTLELPPPSEVVVPVNSSDPTAPDPAEMEAALNELGVQTRE